MNCVYFWQLLGPAPLLSLTPSTRIFDSGSVQGTLKRICSANMEVQQIIRQLPIEKKKLTNNNNFRTKEFCY